MMQISSQPLKSMNFLVFSLNRFNFKFLKISWCVFFAGVFCSPYSTCLAVEETWKMGRLSSLTNPIGTIRDTTTFDSSTLVDSYFRKNSVAEAVFPGYGCTVDNYIYFDLEEFLKGKKTHPRITSRNNLTLDTATANVVTSNIMNSRSFEYVGDFRPGVLLTDDTLLYGRLGIAFNKLSLQLNTNIAASFAPFLPVFATPVDQTHTKNIVGLRLGFGLEKKIKTGWTLRLDYAFTNYRRVRQDDTLTALGLSTIFDMMSFANSNNSSVLNHTVSIRLSRSW